MYPVYCINLEHREDRKKHSLDQFEKIGISSDNVIYPHFIKDPRGGSYGCYDSHMKIWNDFVTNHPEDNFCLVFEDDFVANENSKEIIKNAIYFIDTNYEKVDILFLHNFNISVENEINDDNFVNGYAILSHAYILTRHYIQSIIKNNLLPEYKTPFDLAISCNKKDALYSEKIFYSKQACFKQLVDESDNYLNIFDKFLRKDINEIAYNYILFFKFLKNINISDDDIKKQMCGVDYFLQKYNKLF
jgi:GR25 family glycosyltransferase involved in LPS biosynthesis